MIKNRSSLVWKFTLAFLLVAITTAGLVSIFIRFSSADRLSRLIIDQQASNLQASLTDYYIKTGSWDGVAEQWQQITFRSSPLPTPSTQGLESNNSPKPPPGRHSNFLGLADPQGIVVVSANPDYPEGSIVPERILSSGTVILVNGYQVGTILTPPSRPQFNAEENMFLQRTNEALLYAILGAMGVAFIVALILARTLISPLQALTRAAQNIARGELEQNVTVSTKDEIGHLATAFNAMSQEVARANRLRRQMTADIAHDLRTPLTVIAGYTESMRDGVLQPTTERLSLIYSQIERLQDLVTDLRMLSQADAGELPLHPQSISPKSLLEEAAAPFAHRAATQQVDLVVSADERLPKVNVDEARMMQVFGNLLTNALRYTPVGGKIQLSAKASNGNVTLSVRDSGSGIPAEDLPYIFDRFYRVDKSRSTDTGETGLGLAIVKALVEAHDGKIWAESNCGEYTVFHIALKA